MMDERQFQKLVARVVGRLAQRLGASGEKGCLIVVFTAATVAFSEAVQQVRNLILDGFQLRLAFTDAAEQLLGKAVMDQLAGFPHITPVESSSWLGALREARAVVVPLLSLNTLSKLSLLIADNTAVNLILHGLFMGKPVIVARNGADPCAKGRQELGFQEGRAALSRAMAERLRTIAEYGCMLTDIGGLRATVNSVLHSPSPVSGTKGALSSRSIAPIAGPSGHFITAAEVLQAWRTGAHLDGGAAVGMTPLARELARRYGVLVTSNANRSI